MLSCRSQASVTVVLGHQTLETQLCDRARFASKHVAIASGAQRHQTLLSKESGGSCLLVVLHCLADLINQMTTELIDASWTRNELSDEASRIQVKDSKSESESESFILFESVNDFVFSDVVSNPTLSCPCLENSTSVTK